MSCSFTKSFCPVLSLLLAAALVLMFSFFGPAAAFGAVVSPSSSFYVTDEAAVISPDTEQYIIEKNAELESLCGGQIVVVAVDFLDGMNIEDYAYKIFADWKIGDEDKDNGVLLLLAIGEENYWCMQGKGLENTLTSGTIDDILWYELEPDFAAGDYDAGVRSVFDALYTEVCDIYGVGAASGNSGSGAAGSYYDGSDSASSHSTFAAMIKFCIIVFLLLVVVLFIVTLVTKRRRRSSYVRTDVPGYDMPPSPRPRRRTVFIPTSRPRPPQPPRPSGGSRPSAPRPSAPRPSSSRSSFGGGSRSSGIGRGGGGISRGGGAGRRGR